MMFSLNVCLFQFEVRLILEGHNRVTMGLRLVSNNDNVSSCTNEQGVGVRFLHI